MVKLTFADKQASFKNEGLPSKTRSLCLLQHPCTKSAMVSF